MQREHPTLQLPQRASSRLAPARNRLPTAADLKVRDERLGAIKELIGHLAHALNNSLAPMTGYLALLTEELGKGAPNFQLLSKFEDSMRKTEDVIRALLSATHPERQFVPVPTDLGVLVRRATDRWLQSSANQPEIAVTLDLTAGCELHLDEDLWVKTIAELLRNSELAMPGGGSLSIRLHRRKLSAAQRRVLGIETSACWVLVFEDSGCGMTDDFLRKAFDPLVTTRHQASTPGLGLTRVYSVVRLHGGQIALHSLPGQGTSVTIWLPVPQPAVRPD